jgi:hypothetical protein
VIANLCGLKGEGVATESLGTGDAESGLVEGVEAAGIIACGGYLAKNFSNRGGRLLASAR